MLVKQRLDGNECLRYNLRIAFPVAQLILIKLAEKVNVEKCYVYFSCYRREVDQSFRCLTKTLNASTRALGALYFCRCLARMMDFLLSIFKTLRGSPLLSRERGMEVCRLRAPRESGVSLGLGGDERYGI